MHCALGMLSRFVLLTIENKRENLYCHVQYESHKLNAVNFTVIAIKHWHTYEKSDHRLVGNDEKACYTKQTRFEFLYLYMTSSFEWKFHHIIRTHTFATTIYIGRLDVFTITKRNVCIGTRLSIDEYTQFSLYIADMRESRIARNPYICLFHSVSFSMTWDDAWR